MRKNSLFLNIEYLFLHFQIRTHFVRSLRREEHEYYKLNFCWTNYFLVAVLLHIHFILFVMMTICDSSSLNKVDLTWTPPTVWDNVLFYWTQNKIILNYLHFLHEPSHADHHLLLVPRKSSCLTLYCTATDCQPGQVDDNHEVGLVRWTGWVGCASSEAWQLTPTSFEKQINLTI